MAFFKGKTAIITGAGSGIGQALGESLAQQGAITVLSDINQERINVVAEAINASGQKARGGVLDVRDFDAFKALVDKTVKDYGRLDYIFNNAGIGVGGEARDTTIEDWRNVLDINLYGVVNGVAAAYPIMAEQGFGHIINTASIEGLCPFPGTVSYVASKYGVVGLSHSLRVEGAALGVKVSAVCPGYVKTRIFEDAKVVRMDRDKVLSNLPPDWSGVTPQQCAKIILSGVRKNKGTIVVTPAAKILWGINRVSPPLFQWLMSKGLDKARKGGLRE